MDTSVIYSPMSPPSLSFKTISYKSIYVTWVFLTIKYPKQTVHCIFFKRNRYIITWMLHKISCTLRKWCSQLAKTTIPLAHTHALTWMNELTLKWGPYYQAKLTTNFHVTKIKYSIPNIFLLKERENFNSKDVKALWYNQEGVLN